MTQTIALEAHSTCGSITGSAVLQVCLASVSSPVCPASVSPPVRPASTVVAEPSPTLKFLELCNLRSWSKDDYSRFAVVAVFLLELLRQIGSFFIIPRS